MKNKFSLYTFSENKSELKTGYTNLITVLISFIALCVLISFSS